MVVVPMADEYYARYRPLSHEELYRLLHAGSPAQVDAVADNWRTIEDMIGALTPGLRRDLATLGRSWTGVGAREFQRRIGLVADFAGALADEATALRTGLSVMSGALTEAQRLAEPSQIDAPQWHLDGVLGQALGHTMTPQELAKAHERMVLLVASLAAEYAIADHANWPAAVPDAPEGLPTSPAGSGAAVTSTTSLAGAAPVGQPASAAPVPRFAVYAPPAAPASLPSTTVVPAAVLTGAGSSGLAGANSHLATSVNVPDSGPEPTQPPGQSTPSVIGASPAAGAGDGAAGGVRASGGAAWSRSEGLDWSTNDDPPPSVLGVSVVPT